MGKSLGLIVVVVIALLLLMSGCSTYNSLVTSEERVNEAWSQVESQYQRRADLIPNLVATVKGYASHEERVLTRVTEARARATGISIDAEVLEDPAAFQRFNQAQNEISQALRQLLVVTENYPNLRADQQFLALQSQLEGTENRIAVERKRFNTVVQGYNTQVRRFPANIFAGVFGFEQKEYFRSEPGSERAPEVKFD
jgi:LemA protein